MRIGRFTGTMETGRLRALSLALLTGIGVAAVGLLLAAPGSGAKQGIGNHSLSGNWSFGADGTLEDDGKPGRGFWEVGRFTADGEGNMTGGVEYSNMLSDDESVVNQPFAFEGTYEVKPDGTGTAEVDVTLPNGAVITKTLWFVLNDVRGGVAHGMYGGHLHADLGEHVDGRAGLHYGMRID